MRKKNGHKSRKSLVNISTITLSKIGRKLEVDGIHENGCRSVSEFGGIWPYWRKISCRCSAQNNGKNHCDGSNAAHFAEYSNMRVGIDAFARKS
jgi:hypothetical protein